MKRRKPPSKSAIVARKRAREAANLTVEQLARKLGRKASTIRVFERKGCNNAALAQAWSRTLNCRLELFL